MATLAPYQDGVPEVASVTDREARFPLASRVQHQRVFRLDTKAQERWNGSSWLVDFSTDTPPAEGRTTTDVTTYLLNNEVFSNTDYGATLNGDTTTAVATAFTNATATGKSRVVVIRPGTWTLNNLTIPANGTLIIDSGATVTLNSGQLLSVSDGASIRGGSRLGSVMLLGTNSQIALVGADSSHQIRYCNLERFRLDANDLTSTVPMVQLTWAASAVVRNLYSQRVSSGGLFNLNTSAQGSFDNLVTISQINGSVFNIHNDSDGTSISNSRLSGNLQTGVAGITINGGTAGGQGHAQTTIKNVVMETWDIGVQIANTLDTKLVTLEDLYFEGTKTTGIVLGNASPPSVAQQCTCRRIYAKGNGTTATYGINAQNTLNCVIEEVRGLGNTTAAVFLAATALVTRVSNVLKESGSGVALSVDAAATYLSWDIGILTTHAGGSVLTDDGSFGAIFRRANANPAAQWSRTGTGAFTSFIGLTTTGLEASADWKVDGKFGCNGASPQSAASGMAALAAYGAGANGFDTAGHAQEIHDKLNTVLAILLAMGIGTT